MHAFSQHRGSYEKLLFSIFLSRNKTTYGVLYIVYMNTIFALSVMGSCAPPAFLLHVRTENKRMKKKLSNLNCDKKYEKSEHMRMGFHAAVTVHGSYIHCSTLQRALFIQDSLVENHMAT